MNLEFFVSRRKLTRKVLGPTVVAATGEDTFTIDFDEEWDGLIKVVELKNGDACVQVFYEGKTALPGHVCGSGALYLTCYGFRNEEDITAVMQTAPMVRPVQMVGISTASDDNDQVTVPALVKQLIAKGDLAEQAAETAKNTAAELLALKEKGAFDAVVQVLSVQQGAPARVENLGTPGHAILRFILPYALSDEEKRAMAEQIKTEAIGEIDAALDLILVAQEECISHAEGGLV